MNCFNPEEYDNDIIVVEMQSLGRGRGFEKTGEYSALDDEDLTGRISERLRKLLLVMNGDSGNRDTVDGTILEDQVEEFEDEKQALKTELDLARRKIEELDKANEESESLEELLFKINEVLGDTYDEDFVDLESAVGALIDEYHDAVEEAEDLV